MASTSACVFSLGLAGALALAGCGIIPGLGTSSGTGGSGTTTTTTSTSSGTSTPTGSDCGQDPNTGAILCIGNSLCPGLTVDQSAFPGCGYRVAGQTVDIECSCGGYLCPLGAASCSDATSKLASSNLGAVCAQESTGACIQGTPTTTSSSSSSSGSSSSCDTTCRDECAGDPTCIENCGC